MKYRLLLVAAAVACLIFSSSSLAGRWRDALCSGSRAESFSFEDVPRLAQAPCDGCSCSACRSTTSFGYATEDNCPCYKSGACGRKDCDTTNCDESCFGPPCDVVSATSTPSSSRWRDAFCGGKKEAPAATVPTTESVPSEETEYIEKRVCKGNRCETILVPVESSRAVRRAYSSSSSSCSSCESVESSRSTKSSCGNKGGILRAIGRAISGKSRRC